MKTQEVGKMSFIFLDENKEIIIENVFHYFRKKNTDGKPMILISCRDIKYVNEIKKYTGFVSIKGVTKENQKFPKGMSFSCKKCKVVRAEKRMGGYSEYLLVCKSDLLAD